MCPFVNGKSTSVSGRTQFQVSCYIIEKPNVFSGRKTTMPDSCNGFNHLAKGDGKDVFLILSRGEGESHAPARDFACWCEHDCKLCVGTACQTRRAQDCAGGRQACRRRPRISRYRSSWKSGARAAFGRAQAARAPDYSLSLRRSAAGRRHARAVDPKAISPPGRSAASPLGSPGCLRRRPLQRPPSKMDGRCSHHPSAAAATSAAQ